jgi:hypothetical protein
MKRLVPMKTLVLVITMNGTAVLHINHEVLCRSMIVDINMSSLEH